MASSAFSCGFPVTAARNTSFCAPHESVTLALKTAGVSLRTTCDSALVSSVHAAVLGRLLALVTSLDPLADSHVQCSTAAQ